MNTTPLETRPHALYRFYGAGDTPLYIGITADLPTRFGNHSSLKPWWCDIVRMTVEHFPDRVSVLAAEKAAIIAERPIYNRTHNSQVSASPALTSRPVPAGTPTWTFSSQSSGYTRTVPLWLYWEVHCDPISDDYFVDEIDAAELWRTWLDRYPADGDAEAIYGRGAFAIYWYVEGPGVFEGAPLVDTRVDVHYMRQERGAYPDDKAIREALERRNFLTHFTWPVNPSTGERLRWSRLLVIDKVWRTTHLPDPHAHKGGFIQEATGWKPAPLQPFVNVHQLGQMAGLYVPGRGL